MSECWVSMKSPTEQFTTNFSATLSQKNAEPAMIVVDSVSIVSLVDLLLWTLQFSYLSEDRSTFLVTESI